MSEFPSFSRLKNTIFYLYIFLICASVDEHLVCSHLLATVNNATMNMTLFKGLREPDFSPFEYITRSGIVGSNSNSDL